MFGISTGQICKARGQGSADRVRELFFEFDELYGGGNRPREPQAKWIARPEALCYFQADQRASA